MINGILGSTGVTVPAIALGGIVVSGMDRRHAGEIVSHALDTGATYWDAAPSYGDCEEVLGPFIEAHRKRIFLACKTTDRTAAGARRELDQSLMRLRTDHLDLYQAHAVNTLEDVETFFSPTGALKTLVEAREQGKARFLGFSAHSEEAALEMMKRFDFDTVLFPINWVCWLRNDFGRKVVEDARERGMGVLALKAMARQRWPESEPAMRERYRKCWYQPEDRPEIARLALRFTRAQGVSVCIPPGDPNVWELAISFADDIDKPLTADEITWLRQEASHLNPIFPQD